jgi:hypothetical protein
MTSGCGYSEEEKREAGNALIIAYILGHLLSGTGQRDLQGSSPLSLLEAGPPLVPGMSLSLNSVNLSIWEVHLSHVLRVILPTGTSNTGILAEARGSEIYASSGTCCAGSAI